MNEVTEQQADANREYCRLVKAQMQRHTRHSRCMYANTKACDGWIKDQDGHCRCEHCDHFALRTLSGDTDIEDAEGTSSSFMEKIADLSAITGDESKYLSIFSIEVKHEAYTLKAAFL